jgi:hypothetical protein
MNDATFDASYDVVTTSLVKTRQDKSKYAYLFSMGSWFTRCRRTMNPRTQG